MCSVIALRSIPAFVTLNKSRNERSVMTVLFEKCKTKRQVYNGRRKHKRRVPLLFQKGLSIRKTGMIGKWFAKGKGKLWKEYRDECEQRRMKRNKYDVPVVTPSQELASGSGSTTPENPEENEGCAAAANEDASSESIAVPDG